MITCILIFIDTNDAVLNSMCREKLVIDSITPHKEKLQNEESRKNKLLDVHGRFAESTHHESNVAEMTIYA